MNELPEKSLAEPWLILLLVWSVFFAMIIAVGPYGIFLYGFVPYLERVSTTIEWSQDGVLTGLASLIVFVAGFHWLAKWLTNKWRWRQTIVASAVVMVAFAAGVALIGVVHQATWLIRGPEPIDLDARAKVGPTIVKNHLQQIGIGALEHAAKHADSLPPGYSIGKHGEPLHGWMTFLLPTVEKSTVFHMINFERPWNSDDNLKAAKVNIDEYDSPYMKVQNDEAGFGLSAFAGNLHVLKPGQSVRVDDITDGTAFTILAGEVAAGFRPWAHPLNLRDPAKGFGPGVDQFRGLRSDGTTIVVMADGSTRTLKNNVSPAVLRALATPAGGEALPGNWDE